MGEALEIVAAFGLLWGFMTLFKPGRSRGPFRW
jgi:hypothetical protein